MKANLIICEIGNQSVYAFGLKIPCIKIILIVYMYVYIDEAIFGNLHYLKKFY